MALAPHKAHIPPPRLQRKSSSNRPLVPKLIVMTGGTGVIGNAMVRELCTVPGLELHLLIRNEEKFNKLSKAWANIKEESCTIVPHVVDLSSKKAIQSFLESFKKEHKSLDVLINAAAIVPKEREVAKEEKLELQFVVNILSFFRLMVGLLPLLDRSMRKNGGRVVNIADKNARNLVASDLNFRIRQYNSTTAYEQSKAAIRMLTGEAARKWAKYDVTFHCCHPGDVLSPVSEAMGMEKSIHTAKEAAVCPVWLVLHDKLDKETSGEYWMSKKTSIDRFKNHKDCPMLWAIVEKFSSL